MTAPTDGAPTDGAPTDGAPTDGAPDETVAEVANVYLGNILWAIERAAMALDDDGKPDHSAFYRGIGRKLAEARGRETRRG